MTSAKHAEREAARRALWRESAQRDYPYMTEARWCSQAYHWSDEGRVWHSQEDAREHD